MELPAPPERWLEHLERAWDHVLERDQEDGFVAPSVRRFADRASEELADLASQLATSTYSPRRLRQVPIPKESGGRRLLQIPTARDRVVERCVSQLVAPIVEAHFSPSAFGYRTGLGVGDATRRVTELRSEGFVHVVRCDIDDCFPTIERPRLIRMLGTVVGAEGQLFGLVQRLIEREVWTDHGMIRPARGISQGGSLSPLLSNLYLHPVDLGLHRAGVPHVRFADDLVLLARTADEAYDALQRVERLVAAGGQRLGADKTKVTSFAEGFVFLGEDFNQRYPADSETHHRASPKLRSVYVGSQGAGVRVSKGRLIVERDGVELLSVPTGHVGRLVTSGAVGVSAGARSWALGTGTEIVLLSRRGSYLGRLASGTARDAGLRRLQYRLTDDDDWRLGPARRMIDAKLANQRTLLLRYVRPENADTAAPAAEQIEGYRSHVSLAASSAQLMGIEGAAGREYWAAFAALLPEGLGFEGRRRRPPPDVVNAALGYAAAILCGAAEGALASVGLDPAAGTLHSDAPRRPSLALDLMEEFRPVIVDTTVLAAFRRKRLGLQSIRRDDRRPGGVLLSEAGRRALTAALEDRLLTEFRHIPSGRRLTYRRALIVQAGMLARSVRRQENLYQPVYWR